MSKERLDNRHQKLNILSGDPTHNTTDKKEYQEDILRGSGQNI